MLSLRGACARRQPDPVAGLDQTEVLRVDPDAMPAVGVPECAVVDYARPHPGRASRGRGRHDHHRGRPPTGSAGHKLPRPLVNILLPRPALGEIAEVGG